MIGLSLMFSKYLNMTRPATTGDHAPPQQWWSTILFSVPWPFHFEIHFAGPVLPTLTPQATILEILSSVINNSFFENNKIFLNHILLMFKLYVYTSREKKFININNLIAEMRKLKRTEKEIALNNLKKQLLLQKNRI